MTFSRKIILIAAVALAISLGTACSFFDATPEVNHKTAKPTATGEATNSALPPENGAPMRHERKRAANRCHCSGSIGQ